MKSKRRGRLLGMKPVHVPPWTSPPGHGTSPPRGHVPPWEESTFISCTIPLPSLTFVQEGWKEMDHQTILKEKEKIAAVESLDEWELRKKITNPYEAIFSGSDENVFPSLAKVHPLSRSYFKMIEMLGLCNFWEKQDKKTPFISAHICEGPGGFLQHVVEHAKSLGLPIHELYAMTLKPTKSHIPGWRRSIGFLRKHPQIQLEYGADDTGNILLPINQRAFCERVQGKAQLFTADGGFDFSIDYGKQEESAFPLLLASFTMGLRSLAKGGTMIIKLFDIYSDATQDLFLGSSTFFKSFTIYKPATSRPCNSERYFIGTGFLGIEAAAVWSKHLLDAQVRLPLTRLCGSPWPSQLKAAVLEQIRWQEQLQLNAIHDTLTFTKDTMVERMEANIAASTHWCDVFHVRR